MTFLKYTLISFMVLWLVVYVALCWLEFDILNPIQYLLNLPSNYSYRVNGILLLIGWLVSSVAVANVLSLLDPFNFRKRGFDHE